ncbi:MAG: hypothetical protein ACXWL2_01015 [Candidatus Chromulinivorax sp.]
MNNKVKAYIYIAFLALAANLQSSIEKKDIKKILDLINFDNDSKYWQNYTSENQIQTRKCCDSGPSSRINATAYNYHNLSPHCQLRYNNEGKAIFYQTNPEMTYTMQFGENNKTCQDITDPANPKSIKCEDFIKAYEEMTRHKFNESNLKKSMESNFPGSTKK